MQYPFHVLSMDQVPREIIEKARRIRSSGGYILTTSAGEKYGMISAGAQPNPGYSIQLISVEDGDHGPIITARIQPPRPDEIYIQVISYPFLIGTIAQNTVSITVRGLPKGTLEHI